MPSTAGSKHPPASVPDDQDAGTTINPQITYTAEEEKAVLRKIDLVILPFLCLVFFLQYLDKQSLSYAGIFGLIDDLDLTPSQYSWCSSVFFLGQLVSEYPFIYLMSRLPLARFVGATVILWGLICMALAAPQSFASFAAVRFILGAAEGVVSPAFVTMTSIWWRKGEHAPRIALWLGMTCTAQVVGCLLMYGIGRNGSLGLAPWRVLFLVCGALTAVCGVAFTVAMPQGPRDAWFLTARERQVLVARMAQDREGGDKTSFSGSQLREALRDPKVWIALVFGVLSTMPTGVLTFAAFVVKGIGYDRYDTMLYTAPSGAVQFGMLLVSMAACRLFPRNRTLVAVGFIIPPIVGTVLLMKLPLDRPWGIMVSAWLASCITAIASVILSLSASNIKGNTKRSITNALFFIGYCAGCIASPQLWTNSPRYPEGTKGALVAWCLLILTTLVYRWLCVSDNKRRDADADASGSDAAQIVILDKNGQPSTDLTDKEDHQFRYSY